MQHRIKTFTLALMLSGCAHVANLEEEIVQAGQESIGTVCDQLDASFETDWLLCEGSALEMSNEFSGQAKPGSDRHKAACANVEYYLVNCFE